MAEFLLADIGSTFTKVCLADTARRQILALAKAPTTIQTDVNIGLDNAIGQLAASTENVQATLACSSAAGGLRMAAVGLVPDLTMEAARMAALGAGAKVIKTFSYTLTDDDAEELHRINPDMVLLTGGTDGGDQQHILKNAKRLNEALTETPIVVAGNRVAHAQLRSIFANRSDVIFTENVLPELNRLNLHPARSAIRDLFLRRIVHAKGLDRLQSRAKILMPTPEAVFLAASLLSKGSIREDGWGDLLLVDIGGATTDVFSCTAGEPESSSIVLRGLPEPFVKRTVEGDIGMRYTLESLLQEMGPLLKWQVDREDMEAWRQKLICAPWVIPQSEKEAQCDAVLARAACQIAVSRHAGTLEEAFSPHGRIFVQHGKDLGRVRRVIGTGGPLAAGNAQDILSVCRRRSGESHLLPKDFSTFLDKRYILWAMGLLSTVDPEAALEIMKREIVPIATDKEN